MKWEQRPVLDRFQWHPVFLWLPMSIEGYWVWLEWVERRLEGYGGGPPEPVYEYRIPLREPNP